MINTAITRFEKSLVAAFLRDTDQFRNLIGHVPVEMFTTPIYAKAIKGMHECAAKGVEIDSLNIATLTKMNTDELMEVSDILIDNSVGGYAPELFRQLLNERVKVQAFTGVKRIGLGMVAGKYDAMEIITELNELHTDINAQLLSHETKTKESKLEEFRQHLVTGASTRGIIPTPFWAFNKMLNGGFRPGDYVLIGGRPGAGKSSFMLAMALHAAKIGKKVAFLSGEMPMTEVHERLAGIYTGMNISDIRESRGEGIMRQYFYDMDRMPLDVFECFENSLEQLQREVGSLFYKGFDMICIDYLQKFAFSPKAINEFHEIQKVSGALRNFSLKKNTVFLVASSMNRGEFKTEMTLHSFYGSSKLGHDGTIGLIMDAEENDVEEQSSGERAWTLNVAKNRNGARGKLSMEFHMRTQRMNEKGSYPEPVLYSQQEETEPF